VSIKAELAIQRIRRGERVLAVREALGINGDEFAELLRRHLLAYGIDRKYDKAKVSRMESGRRDLLAEELAVIASVDPEQRGMLWLIFGEAARGDATKHFPKPHRGQASAARPARSRRRGGGGGRSG